MIRKVYHDFLLAKLKQEGVGWLARRARQYLLMHLSPLAGRALCGPVHGSLMVTRRCNCDCTMCDIPSKRRESDGTGGEELDTARFKEIIGEFARLGTPGLGFTGGEPLLRPDIYELLACSRHNGMITHLNTNGYFLDDAAVRHIVDAGVESVNISLDGASPATHDRIRNCGGAFERATAAVGRLHRLRRERGVPLRIKMVAVLGEANIDEAGELAELSRELGADCIEFIPCQPLTGDGSDKTTMPHESFLEKVDRLADYLLAMGRERGMVENSPAHLRLFRSSFAGVPSPVRCRAGYHSLSVDCHGDVFPCFPRMSWGRPAGNVRHGSLVDLWHSDEYQTHRDVASACRNCYLNCHLELNLLFDHKARMGFRRGSER
ncbi:radical SAM protein [Geobacter pickeringii]|uniref:Radical SAM protein n=1 Tax=Geobacter pickeringii TaxID=345632 RepID=A0A0B5BD72_9BACT|nr:radical SAM protein [Geobacter pickeringii]AJE02495.1 radical SAM protein [Geobacter pickeringii]